MTERLAIPLAGLSTRQRLALLRLTEAPGLEHEVDADENYLRFEAHSPSAGQLALWAVAVSIAGFGEVDLFDALSTDPESAAAVVEAVRLVAA